MAKRQKFGKFVLLAETARSSVGAEYRAAKLGPAGLDRMVRILCLAPAVTADAERTQRLMDAIKQAAQLHSPNVVKILGIGKVDSTFYVSTELTEARSLRAIFDRCRQEGFPFSVDHALLVASKVCSALEYAHSRRHVGGRYLHGLVSPSWVLVSYEGEVQVGGFGLWQGGLVETGALGDAETACLAPEQSSGGAAGTSADTFAVGALLFEALTGEGVFAPGRGVDPLERIAQARLLNPGGADDAVPEPIAAVLRRALDPTPSNRFAEIEEMRRAIDTLLFSGDFAPTTFNLAFFMHSLFREDIEAESVQLERERGADYSEFAEEPRPPTPPAVPVSEPTARRPAVPAPEVVPAPPRAEVSAEAEPAAPAEPEVAQPAAGVANAEPPPPRGHEPPPRPTPAVAPTVDVGPPPAAPGSRLPLLAIVAVVVIAAAAGAYFLLLGSSTPSAPAPTTLSAQAVEAMRKAEELERRLAQLEAEKEEAVQRAEDEARKRAEAEAQASGRQVDPETLARVQAEARRRAQEEQARLREEERLRLQREKEAEEARLAEERRKAEAAAAAAAAATTTLPAAPTTTEPPTTLAAPTTTAPAPTTTLPPVQAGDLVNLSDAGVVPPKVKRQPTLRYPPIAKMQRVEGVVVLNALVDEKGDVVEVAVVVEAGGRTGLTEAAVENVESRKYEPATKNGVPVKVWLPVRIAFKLPR